MFILNLAYAHKDRDHRLQNLREDFGLHFLTCFARLCGENWVGTSWAILLILRVPRRKTDQSLRTCRICNYSAMKKGSFLLVADGNSYILTIVQSLTHEYPIEMDVFEVYRPAGVVPTEGSAEGLDEPILTVAENLLTESSMGCFYIKIGLFNRRNQLPNWSKNILNNLLRKVIL